MECTDGKPQHEGQDLKAQAEQHNVERAEETKLVLTEARTVLYKKEHSEK